MEFRAFFAENAFVEYKKFKQIDYTEEEVNR